MAHWLYLPDDAVEDLAVLARLSAAQVEALCKYFDTNEIVQKYNYYTKVADLVSISDDAASGLCGFVSYVQSQRAKQKQDAATVPDELLKFLRRVPKTKESPENLKPLAEYVEKHRPLLVKLFSDCSGRDHSDKLRELETGPLPHLHSVRTLCDLRPVYDAEASEILTYLPLVTLSMVIHRNWSDDFEEVAVLLTEGDIADLRATLDRLDKKLAILKQRHQPTDTKLGEG